MVSNLKQLLQIPLFYIYVILSGIISALTVEIDGTASGDPSLSTVGLSLILFVCILVNVPISYIVIVKVRDTLIEKSVSVWQLFIMSFAYILKLMLPLVLLFLALMIPLIVIFGAESVKSNYYILAPLGIVVAFIFLSAWFYTVANGSSRGVLFKGGVFLIIRKHFLLVFAFTLVAGVAGILPEILKVIIPYSPFSPALILYFVLQVLLTGLSFTMFFWVLQDVVEAKTIDTVKE